MQNNDNQKTYFIYVRSTSEKVPISKAQHDAFYKEANHKQDYDAIADEILRLREQKEHSEVDNHHREETMIRIKELQDFISKQKTDITEFDETLVNKLIEKITAFVNHFIVEFKSGLTIEIEA